MKERTDMFFDTSPVFQARCRDGRESGRQGGSRGSTRATPLKSGWAWGQQYLQNGVAAIEAPLGKGRVLLFGPEIIKRAQPHGDVQVPVQRYFLFDRDGLAQHGSVAGRSNESPTVRIDVEQALTSASRISGRADVDSLHRNAVDVPLR